MTLRIEKKRDHCHYTGLCNCTVHNNCNLKYRIPDHIPVPDAHLFIKELGEKFNKDDIAAKAENKEKYISFNVKISVKQVGVTNKDDKEVRKNIRLSSIDSGRFMTSSLNKLASNFKEFYNEDETINL